MPEGSMPLPLKREHGCWVQQAQEIGENGSYQTS